MSSPTSPTISRKPHRMKSAVPTCTRGASSVACDSNHEAATRAEQTVEAEEVELERLEDHHLFVLREDALQVLEVARHGQLERHRLVENGGHLVGPIAVALDLPVEDVLRRGVVIVLELHPDPLQGPCDQKDLLGVDNGGTEHENVRELEAEVLPVRQGQHLRLNQHGRRESDKAEDGQLLEHLLQQLALDAMLAHRLLKSFRSLLEADRHDDQHDEHHHHEVLVEAVGHLENRVRRVVGSGRWLLCGRCLFRWRRRCFGGSGLL
eukprot:scaffold16089_cov54-Phaeocystis_antarctica.AAC.3